MPGLLGKGSDLTLGLRSCPRQAYLGSGVWTLYCHMPVKLMAEGRDLRALHSSWIGQQGSQFNPTMYACETILGCSGPGTYFPNKELDIGGEWQGQSALSPLELGSACRCVPPTHTRDTHIAVDALLHPKAQHQHVKSLIQDTHHHGFRLQGAALL